MSIPLPAIAEQKSIVAKIDALFVEIDRAINLIDDKNKNFQNYFNQCLQNCLTLVILKKSSLERFVM